MMKKNRNFYVKKMQKCAMVLVGVLWLAMVFTGCTKKTDEGMTLFPLDEKAVKDETESFRQEDVPDAEETSQPQLGTLPEPVISPALLCVHVCGAVQNPGVYELPAGSRVYEAIALAGGFTEDAAQDYVNQAQAVLDAAKIVIPTIEEAEALQEQEADSRRYGILTTETDVRLGTQNGQTQEDLVNLNTAGKAELCTLPGIGEAKAEAIIRYRTQIGCFSSKEQLMEITGIKDTLYETLQDKICVN